MTVYNNLMMNTQDVFILFRPLPYVRTENRVNKNIHNYMHR